MKKAFKVTLLTAALLGSFQSFGQTSRPLTTQTSDGGPILTKYGVGDVDKDSTLHRSWHTVNDATCPIQLVKAGVKTEQRIGTTNLEYKPVVESFTASEPITAMEMRFALYDVFNEHIVTLEITRVEDVAAPGPFMFKMGLQDNNPDAMLLPQIPALSHRSTDDYLRSIKESEQKITEETAKNPSRFGAQPNDVERLLTVVSFVSQVRTKNGTVWRYDPAAVVAEVTKLLHSKVAETTLNPKNAAP